MAHRRPRGRQNDDSAFANDSMPRSVWPMAGRMISHFQRMDERRPEPLATARFFVRHPHHFDIVSRCTSNYYFNESDTAATGSAVNG